MSCPTKITLGDAVEFFKKNDNFLILCHTNPDGDTLGSGYGLCGVLHLMGKRAKVIYDEKPSPRFVFLLEAINPEQLDFHPDIPETVVAVDVADIELLGALREEYGKKVALCIDHHISNKFFAEKTLIDVKSAACAELVWKLIKKLMGRKLKYTFKCASIASAIYTGVSTDTGCFKYSNTTAKSHIIAAELIDYGADIDKINYLMFEMKTRERITLEQEVYAGLEYFFDGRCAIAALTADMLEGVDPEDAGNVSILPKQIEGVEIGVIIKEKRLLSSKKTADKTWKVSVRTNTSVNAQSICACLKGGGHIRAAGCTLTGNLENVKKLIIKEVGKQL